MLEVTKPSLTRIHSEKLDSYGEPKEIIVDSEACCPSIIGLKNPNEVHDKRDYRCNYQCYDCWNKALADVDDFKILWKYKGSDEYV